MTFCSLIRITLIGGSLWACVNQYQSPGGEVEETSAEPSATPEAPSEEMKPSSSSSDMPAEAPSSPSEASGTCDDRTCTYTTDCCKGYECGFDPGRSKVMRYCMSL